MLQHLTIIIFLLSGTERKNFSNLPSCCWVYGCRCCTSGSGQNKKDAGDSAIHFGLFQFGEYIFGTEKRKDWPIHFPATYCIQVNSSENDCFSKTNRNFRPILPFIQSIWRVRNLEKFKHNFPWVPVSLVLFLFFCNLRSFPLIAKSTCTVVY